MRHSLLMPTRSIKMVMWLPAIVQNGLMVVSDVFKAMDLLLIILSTTIPGRNGSDRKRNRGRIRKKETRRMKIQTGAMKKRLQLRK